MTQQEMLEYNKRCAEFLGYSFKKHDNQPNAFWDIDFGKPYPQTRDMLFHSDWNWTHEVIREIENIRDVRDVTINSVGCIIFHKEGAFSGFSDNKHEAVVEAINQFLIWYNENNT